MEILGAAWGRAMLDGPGKGRVCASAGMIPFRCDDLPHRGEAVSG
jgi:hypothetical protein